MQTANTAIPSAAGAPPRAIIRPSRGWAPINFREFWHYRELLYFLVWRDVKVRYKQTILGAGWAIIQPVMTMVVFSVVFGRLAKISSDGFPYPIFAYTALLPWTYFSGALGSASNSMLSSSHLITKVYFPRLIVPVASVLSGLLDFVIAFTVLGGMMMFYHIRPTTAVVVLPFLLLLALITALGVGLWLAALNVEYRDVRYTVPFILQFWMYATPVAYPSSLLGEPWRTLFGLNPMVGVVEGFRWALLGAQPPGATLFVSIFIALALLVSGLFYFRRMERTFADVV